MRVLSTPTPSEVLSSLQNIKDGITAPTGPAARQVLELAGAPLAVAAEQGSVARYARATFDLLPTGLEPVGVFAHRLEKGVELGLFTQADIDAAIVTGKTRRANEALSMVRAGSLAPGKAADLLNWAVDNKLFTPETVAEAILAGSTKGSSVQRFFVSK